MKPQYKSPIIFETKFGQLERYGKYRIGESSYIICHSILPKNIVCNDTGYDLYKFGIDKIMSKHSRQGCYFMSYIIVEGNIELFYEDSRDLGATKNEISKFKDIVETIIQHKIKNGCIGTKDD